MRAAASKTEPASASPDAGLIDEAALALLAESLREDVLALMLDIFIRNVVQYGADIHAAAASGDLKGTKQIAHALKGVCAQFGAPRLAGLAEFVEDRAEDMAEVLLVFREVEDVIAATAAAITVCKHALTPGAQVG